LRSSVALSNASSFTPWWSLKRSSQKFQEFNEEHRKLQRSFLSGVTTVELDSNGRLLIPKNMLTSAGIDKDVILVGTGSKVEIWNPSIYEKNQIQDPGELSKLAEKYLNE
jgi:MraZ protein